MKTALWKKIGCIILIEIFSISQFSWGVVLQDNFATASGYNPVPSAPTDLFKMPDTGTYGDITLRLAESDPVTSVSTVDSVLNDFNINSSGISAGITSQTALDVSMADDATMIITFGETPSNMNASHDIQGFIVCRPTEDGGALQVTTVVEKGKLSDFFSGDELSEICSVNQLSSEQIVSRIDNVLENQVVYSYPKQVEDTESFRDIPLITRDFLDTIISREIEQLEDDAAHAHVAKINPASDEENPEAESLEDSNLSAYLIVLKDIQSRLPSESLQTLTQEYIQAKLNETKRMSNGVLQDSFGYINGSLVAVPSEDIWLSDESSLTRDKKVAIIEAWMKQAPLSLNIIPVNAWVDDYANFKNDIQSITNGDMSLNKIIDILNNIRYNFLENADRHMYMNHQNIYYSNELVDDIHAAEGGIEYILSSLYDYISVMGVDMKTATFADLPQYIKDLFDNIDIYSDLINKVENQVNEDINKYIESNPQHSYLTDEICRLQYLDGIEVSFKALEDSSDDVINDIFSRLKTYADSTLPQYAGAISTFKDKLSSYKDLITKVETEFDTTVTPAGELLTALDELNNISQGIAALKMLLSQAILLDQSIDNLLQLKSSALGGAVMSVVNPIAEFLDQNSIFGYLFNYEAKDMSTIKGELQGLQVNMRVLIYNTFDDFNEQNLTDAMTQLGLLQSTNDSPFPTLVEDINTSVNNLLDAKRRNDVAGVATGQLIQFVALSVISGAVGSVLRSTETFARIATAFNALKSGGRAAKAFYWVAKAGIGGAIIALNVIDNMQESALAFMGRPGALIASLVFPGSKLAALAVRMGLNGVVVGLSTGLANYYQGTTLGNAAALVGNPFIVLNWIGGDSQNAWLNNLIQPFGIPLPDIAEFLHLIVYGTDRLPFSLRQGSSSTVDISPVAATEGMVLTSMQVDSLSSVGFIAQIPEPIRRSINALVERLNSSKPATITTDSVSPVPEPVTTDTTEDNVATTLVATKNITECTSDDLDTLVNNILNRQENKNVKLNLNPLKDMLEVVKEEMAGEPSDSDSDWTKAYRLGMQYLSEKYGKATYPAIYQLIAAYLMTEGKNVVGTDNVFLNVFTGQGKTVSILMANFVLSELRPNGPVITLSSHAALVERDVAELGSFYEQLKDADGNNKTFATLNKEGKLVDVRGNELADQNLNHVDFIYAEATAPIFYVLRQLAQGNYETWDKLENVSLVLDEVDAVLVEQALSPCIISEGTEEHYGQSAAEFFEQVGGYARGDIRLQQLLSVTVQEWNNHVNGKGEVDEFWVKDQIKRIIPASIKNEETPQSINRLVNVVMMAPVVLDRYVGQYIVDTVDGKNQVIILSDFSDEPQIGKHWMGWIHQLIEAAHGLPVSKNTNTTQVLTMQEFVNQCGFVTGASGTAYVFSDIFWQVYNGGTVTMPKNFPEIRNDHVLGYTNPAQQVDDMLNAAVKYARTGNSVLLTTSRENVDGFLSRLESMTAGEDGMSVQKYDAHDWLNEEARKSIETKAAKGGRITVTTQILGRGMNIVGNNPLIVIADRLFSKWSSDQIIGRAYRGGSSGESYIYFSTNETERELREKAGVQNPKELLDRLDITAEGQEFDLNDPNIVEIQREYLKKYLSNIQVLAEKYRLLIEFETQSTGEGAPLYYLRPLTEQVNEDAFALYEQFREDIYSVDELRDIINSSMLISQSAKDDLLKPLGTLDGSVTGDTIFELIDSYLDNGPQSRRKSDFLKDRFLQKYINFYKNLVFSNMDHPNYQGEGGYNKLIDDAYLLFKIKAVLDLYALASNWEGSR